MELTYTNVLFKLIIEIIRTSMLRDNPTMHILNLTRLLYLVRPFATRFC
jgi:hypothetical protein